MSFNLDFFNYMELIFTKEMIKFETRKIWTILKFSLNSKK